MYKIRFKIYYRERRMRITKKMKMISKETMKRRKMIRQIMRMITRKSRQS
jgi:hypothetical protein